LGLNPSGILDFFSWNYFSLSRPKNIMKGCKTCQISGPSKCIWQITAMFVKLTTILVTMKLVTKHVLFSN